MTHLEVYIDGGNVLPWKKNAGGTSILNFAANIHGQAMHLDESFYLKPGYIEEWHWDYKRSVYVLKIDKKLKFHDNTEFTAFDAEFTILKSLFLKENLPLRNVLLNIQGAEKVKRGSKFQSGAVSGVKVKNKYELEVALSHPNPSFLYTLARPVPKVVKQSLVTDDYMTPIGLPVGIGKYKVIAISKEESQIAIEKFDTSGSGPKKIKLNLGSGIESSDVLVGTDPELAPKNYSRWESPYPSELQFFDLNWHCPIVKEDDFREALYYAIDRERLLENLDKKIYSAAHEILPDRFFGRTRSKVPPDLERAKDLIKKLPKELREKKYILSVYTKRPNAADRKLAEILNEIGLNVELIQKRQVKFTEQDSSTLGLTAIDILNFRDPQAMFAYYVKGSPTEGQHPKDEKLEKLYQEARSASSLDIRSEALKALGNYLINEKKYMFPLSFIKSVHYFNPKTVKSLGEQYDPLVVDFSKIELQQAPEKK